MSSDFESRLRAAIDELPGPSAEVTTRAEAAMPRVRRPWPGRRWVVGGLGVAAAAALAGVLAVLLVNQPSDASRPARHWQPGTVDVPDFRGLRTGELEARRRAALDEAAKACAAQQYGTCPQGRVSEELRTRVVAARASDRPVGTVLEQSPPPGTRVAQGTWVWLTVAAAKGPEPSGRPPAPDFRLPVVGRPGRAGLDDRRGAVTVLLFTSTVCEACRQALADVQELPSFDTVMPVVTGRRSIATETPNGVLADGVSDEDGSVAAAYGITDYPTWVILDRENRVVTTLDHPADINELKEIVAAVGAEEPPTHDPSRATPLGLSNLPAPLDPAEVPDTLLSFSGCEVDPRRVWLLAEGAAGTRLYIAQGPRMPLGIGGGEGMGCGPSAQSRKPVFAFGTPPGFSEKSYDESHHVTLAVGVVPDGWTEAVVAGRRIPIEHNGIVIEGPLPKGTIVRFTGPAGTKEVRL